MSNKMTISCSWERSKARIEIKSPEGYAVMRQDFTLAELKALRGTCDICIEGIKALDKVYLKRTDAFGSDDPVTPEEDEAFSRLAELSPDGRYTNG